MRVGFPIPGTTVTIVSDNMMGQKQVVTKMMADSCSLSCPWKYTLTAEAAGFRSVQNTNLQGEHWAEYDSDRHHAAGW